MSDSTSTGWRTFTKIRTQDGRVIVVQKNNGCTRSVFETQPKRSWK